MKVLKKSTDRQTPLTNKYLFELGLADVLRLTMLGTLIEITSVVIRLPLHLPGHTSILCMCILVLGKGLIPGFGAGMIMGFVSGTLAVLSGEGKEGIFVFFKYFFPGLLLDFLSPLFGSNLDSPVVGAICGALTSIVKMAVSFIIGLLLNLPLGFLALGLGLTSISHAAFGATGGAIASLLIKRMKLILTNRAKR